MDHFYYDDLYGVTPFGPAHGHNPFSLGPDVVLNDSGVLSPISAGHSNHGGGGGGTSGGGTGGGTTGGTPPAGTMVTATGSNLAIDLVWDSSVSGAPSGFTAAVIAAAQALVTDLSAPSKTVLDIAVGWGEIAGSAMSSGALGESESTGYLTNYATVANALHADGYTLNASNEPTSGQFFVTSAEAKALGMASRTGTAIDGYVGFGSGYSWQFGATGTTGGQFNLQATVEHELTEVMGRISMEGTSAYNGVKTYTPLDLFDFSAPGKLALSNTGGYFSTNNGATNMGNFNDAAIYGGDIGDWASYGGPAQSGTLSSGQDPFDAYSRPGYDVTLSADDLLEMAAVGHPLSAIGLALA